MSAIIVCGTITGQANAPSSRSQTIPPRVRNDDRPPESRFDGVFANASLFHVPSRELPRVLLELRNTLKRRGVLFCSNPRGNNEEGFSDGRYSCFFDLDTWRNYVRAAGFFEVGHYYRPPGLPRHQQPWLATVWRKG